MPTWIIKLLVVLLPLVSGPLREELVKFAKAFREKARQTSNDADDILAEVLCWLLGIE